MRDLRQKLKLQANAEANQRASYYLLNHVARSDDEYLAAAAKKLAETLQKRGQQYKIKADSI